MSVFNKAVFRGCLGASTTRRRGTAGPRGGGRQTASRGGASATLGSDSEALRQTRRRGNGQTCAVGRFLAGESAHAGETTPQEKKADAREG